MKNSTHQLLTVLFGAWLIHGIASADTFVESLAAGQTGKVYFKSVDRKTTAPQLNSGKFQITDTISGEIILPDGVGPFPMMVIAHGSGGITKNNYDWAEFFKARGVGAFVVDSFKERGIGETATDQSQMTYPASAADALVALKLLATHPKVDPSRIGIIGFSRGGQASVGTAFDVWRGHVAGTLKYAVHIPVYGGCSWIADHWDGSPIHFIVGGSDDYNQPVATCEAQTRFLDKAGMKHSLTVYADARHGFDALDRTKDVYAARAQTFNKCSYIWNVERQVIYAPAQSDQTQPPSALPEIISRCWTKGSTIGPNIKATHDAHARVAQILDETILKR